MIGPKVGFKSPNFPPTNEPIAVHAIYNPRRQQQQRVHAYRQQSSSYTFFNLLTSEALLSTVEELLPEHRERLYPPTETLSLFLAQAVSADRSCQQIVNQAAALRITGGLSSCSTSTGAYCSARKRLPEKMVSTLARRLGALVDAQAPNAWHWNGRRVRLVDGTTLSMPDTAENQADFPQSRGQKPGLGFPLCRMLAITCLSSGVILDSAIGPMRGKGSGEQGLLRSLQDTFARGDVVLADAYFATYFFIAAMQAKGVDIVMEQYGARKRSTDFRRGIRLGVRDHLITLAKPSSRPEWMTEQEYEATPAAVTVRELKVGHKIIVTTLCCAKSHCKESLKELYKARWQIELDLRNIKETMGMGILSCKSPDMIRKEIWVYVLAYNLIRLVMAQSALLADIVPRCISFKHCLQLWVAMQKNLDICDSDKLRALFMVMAQQRVGNRQGRVEPRAVKRRPKPYPLLTKTREEARAAIRRYGHPKKLK